MMVGRCTVFVHYQVKGTGEVLEVFFIYIFVLQVLICLWLC